MAPTMGIDTGRHSRSAVCDSPWPSLPSTRHTAASPLEAAAARAPPPTPPPPPPCSSGSAASSASPASAASADRSSQPPSASGSRRAAPRLARMALSLNGSQQPGSRTAASLGTGRGAGGRPGGVRGGRGLWRRRAGRCPNMPRWRECTPVPPKPPRCRPGSPSAAAWARGNQGPCSAATPACPHPPAEGHRASQQRPQVAGILHRLQRQHAPQPGRRGPNRRPLRAPRLCRPLPLRRGLQQPLSPLARRGGPRGRAAGARRQAERGPQVGHRRRPAPRHVQLDDDVIGADRLEAADLAGDGLADPHDAAGRQVAGQRRRRAGLQQQRGDVELRALCRAGGETRARG
jgi:hypothetical protein